MQIPDASVASQMPGTCVLVARLVLAGLLGGIIGAEREYRAKTAGVRTHILVAVGSALLLIVSRYGFDGHGDPSRVASQIVSGIGFIGAGAIIVERQSVHGLTTAAGVWVAAGIGMAVACGLTAVAVAATVISLVGLEILGWGLFRRHQAEDAAQGSRTDADGKATDNGGRNER